MVSTRLPRDLRRFRQAMLRRGAPRDGLRHRRRRGTMRRSRLWCRSSSATCDRGRRLARVGSALNGAASLSHPGPDRLSEAETTLERINADNADARAIREEMAPQADRLTERLSDQGFGRPVTVSPADVMARLRMMAAAPVLIESGLEINSQP